MVVSKQSFKFIESYVTKHNEFESIKEDRRYGISEEEEGKKTTILSTFNNAAAKRYITNFLKKLSMSEEIHKEEVDRIKGYFHDLVGV